MRTHKTKPAPERAEEPVEPVRATESAPVDHTATDKLLDTIEALLDPATEEETKPKPTWMTDENFRLLFASFDPARDTLQFLPRSRTEGDQERLYEEYERAVFERERNQTPTEDIPWAEIARMPDPGPRGRTIEFVEPMEEINWAIEDDDPTRIVAITNMRTRVIHVTRAMWEEARRGFIVYDRFDRPRRFHGDDGICPRCHHPLAGPGYPPCGNAGTSMDTRAWSYGIATPPPDPKAAIRITNC